MYRVVALCALERRVDWADEPALALLSTPLAFEFLICDGHLTISVGGRNLTQAIRSQAVAEGAARVATIPPVRAILVDKQRQLGCAGGVVMDGRDIGTIVFPDAEVKFYLDATLEARARRRWLELRDRGELTTLSEVTEAIGRRDQEDRTRDVSPLRVAEGAYSIDTTNLSVDEVFRLMVDKVKFSASLSTLLSPTRE
jgi:cytidylate kinase